MKLRQENVFHNMSEAAGLPAFRIILNYELPLL